MGGGAAMRKRLTYEERYNDRMRKQRRELEEFLAEEKRWCEYLPLWHRINKRELDDEVYRAVLYFRYESYLKAPAALSLLYAAYKSVYEELRKSALREGLEAVIYRFRTYYHLLKKEGLLTDPSGLYPLDGLGTVQEEK
jgi:hypothetical protein